MELPELSSIPHADGLPENVANTVQSRDKRGRKGKKGFCPQIVLTLKYLWITWANPFSLANLAGLGVYVFNQNNHNWNTTYLCTSLYLTEQQDAEIFLQNPPSMQDLDHLSFRSPHPDSVLLSWILISLLVFHADIQLSISGSVLRVSPWLSLWFYC